MIFAFRRDLRLGDHPGLAVAGRLGQIVPVLVIDAALRKRLQASPRRAAFFCNAVAALDVDLRRHGSRLTVRRGQRGPVLRALARLAGATAVGWSIEYDPVAIAADRDLQSVLEEAGLRAVPVHAAPVVPPEAESAVNRRGDAYRALVPYLGRWNELPVPPVSSPAALACLETLGGEALPAADEFGAPPTVVEASEQAAARVCARFVDGPIVGYAAGRNLPAVGGTSRLSAHLAFGTIGAATVVRSVRARLRDPFLLTEERASVRLFLRGFAQRDFFLQLAWHTDALGEAALVRRMHEVRFARSHRALDAWRAGRTGFPLVDAGIRELHASGWMHPRIRAVAASFLCFDLGVDWRVGRDEWDRWLEEDTPALATANWEWVAGVGADLAAYPRVYNPLRMARRIDPAAAYIRQWVPELAHVPDEAIFDPYGGRAQRQLRLDLFGSAGYPPPVLDHAAAARAFLTRYALEARRPPV